jgi:NAD(P)-dependent dehydrogenase (short-subunit alcohol dehydrogenase family)
MLDAFVKDFGSIDALVNNAGGALKMPKGGFVDMPMDYWDYQIKLNLSAAAYCSQIAVRDMRRRGAAGAIVNISSVHSLVTYVRRKTLPYCAAKAGLNMLTKSLGVEVAKYGIRVNCVAPGFIMTKLSGRYSEAQMDAFKRKIPAGVLGTVDDIVPTILFLSDVEKTKFIVGQTFVVDGGQSIDGAIDAMIE